MAAIIDAYTRYDESREVGDKPFRAACYAPFTSMFLDTLGRVRACCVNYRYILGNIRTQRLDDIWFGRKAAALREAMKRYDLRLGCEQCEWQIRDGNVGRESGSHSSLHALKYDEFPLSGETDPWPTNVEFNLANTCNLECVTCSGELSSSIRSRREHLPPLPRAYTDEFFGDLRKYIPRLQTAQFLGGEPFLIQEHHRVWAMLMEGHSLRACGITTNGTIYNERVERVLESLPVWITMSIDGATKETFERLRVNAKHEVFLENFRRFHGYGVRTGRPVSLNFTLSRLNWGEFGDLLLFAEDYGCPVSVCTLVGPAEYSLYTLDRTGLEDVLAALEARDRELSTRLKVNRGVWENTVANLRHRLANEGLAVLPVEAVESHRHWGPFRFAASQSLEEQSERSAEVERSLRELCGEAVARLVTNVEDYVIEAELSFLADLREDVVGRNLDSLGGLFRSYFGPDMQVSDLSVSEERIDRLVSFQGGRTPVTLRLVNTPRFDSSGELSGMTTWIGKSDGNAGGPTPPSIG